MRIISGYLKGRELQSSHGHKTHPMSEKVKGALFNILGDINELTVLDAFAGSGALSFEAISRGAKLAVAIDADAKAYKVINANAEEIDVYDKIKVTKANIGGWSDKNQTTQFDVVIADPPHDNLQLNKIKKLVRHVKKAGILALNWPGKLDPPEFGPMEKIEGRDYGDTQLVFYRRIS